MFRKIVNKVKSWLSSNETPFDLPTEESEDIPEEEESYPDLLHSKRPCLRCWAELDSENESHSKKCTHKNLPPLYLSSSNDSDILPMQLLGWKRHGKTTYFLALLYVLDRMQALWHDLNLLPVTEASVNLLRDARRLFQTTTENISHDFAGRPWVYILRNMAYWGNRTVILHEVTPESSEKFDIAPDHAPLMLKLRTNTTLIFFSPSDFERNRTEDFASFDELMSSFLNSLAKENVLPNALEHRIVLVITKGDKVANKPKAIQEYLDQDPIWNVIGKAEPNEPLFSFPFGVEATRDYIEDMKRADRYLADWLVETHWGRNFFNLAEEYRIPVAISMISSTSGDIGGFQHGRLESRRVLDPFFWTMLDTDHFYGSHSETDIDPESSVIAETI